jgi:4-amino-4-deoxy-L-arabinose transferase-like glycosyltransferase
LLGLCILLALGFIFIHYFQKDELEHIHTTWKMSNGARPFLDFFQHHHPVIWYQSLPIVEIFGASPVTLFAFRFIQFLFLTGILIGTYQIALLATGSRETGYLALLLLLTFKIFIETGLEIRPDVQQVFFCIYGFYFFLKFLQNERGKFLVYSGVSIAIGFLYLQKTLFFLFPMGVVILYLTAFRRLRLRNALIFSLSFAVPVFFFLLYHFLSGQWGEYVLYNWIINLYKTPVEHSWNYYSHMLIWNPFFLILMIPGMLYLAIRYRRIPLPVKLAFFTGAVIFFIAFANPRAWKQYYLPAFPLIAVFLAYMLEDWLAHTAEYKRLLLCLFLVFSALPVFLVEKYFPGENQGLFDAIREQRENVSEYAFDENIVHNLFREDLHYFWYSTHQGRMYDAYLKVVADPRCAWALKKARYDDFDLCRLVEKYKPTMVHRLPDSDHDIEDCDAEKENYTEIAPGTFKRNRD